MESTPKPAAPGREGLLRPRIAISIAFLLLGTGTGIWAVHIPLIQARLGISPAVLGLALLAMATGAMIAMPASGFATGRFGSRTPTAAMMIAYVAVTPLPILAPTVAAFFVAAFVFGFALGGLDVSVNVQASEVERARGRPTMSSFHGFFSVGGLLGAAAGAGIIAHGWGDGRGAATFAVILLGFAAMAAGNLFPGARVAAGTPRFVLPNRAALGLGAIAFLCFAIEGAVTDWSALFLTEVKGASPTAAAAGYGVFSLAMAGFRLFGDGVVAWLGARTVVLAGGLLIVVGLAIAIAVPQPALGAIGFGLVGIGAANAVPVVFSAGARIPGVPPGAGVAAVATMGYLGFLVAPPILGLVGNGFGLSASLAVVLAMGLAVVGLAGSAGPRRR